VFNGEADFRYTTFRERVEFWETRFEHPSSDTPTPLFYRVVFEKPQSVSFYNTNLENAILCHCALSDVSFSNVPWRKRPDNALLGSRPDPIGPITFVVKRAGTRSAGNPHATCDVAGAGNGPPEVSRSHRASSRPYQGSVWPISVQTFLIGPC
jgi:hypothetical protein